MWRLLLSKRKREQWDERYLPVRGVEVVAWLLLSGWFIAMVASPTENWETSASGRRFLEMGGAGLYIYWIGITLLLIMVPRLRDPKRSTAAMIRSVIRETASISAGVLLILLGGIFASVGVLSSFEIGLESFRHSFNIAGWIIEWTHPGARIKIWVINWVLFGFSWTLITPGIYQFIDTVRWAGRGHP